MLVKEVLVWRDLEHAWGCIEKRRKDVQFWRGARAIIVEYVKKVGVRAVLHNLDIAHQICERLRKEIVLVRESGLESQL